MKRIESWCTLKFLVGTLIMLHSPVGVSTGASAADSLATSYPWGHIYITYSQLSKIVSVLNDSQQRVRLFKSHPADILDMLRQFLSGRHTGRINESIAFLQLDPATGKAGFKMASDPGGEIQEIAWTSDQGKQVAQLCHEFLTRIQMAQSILYDFKARSVGLHDGWTTLGQVEATPYLPAEVRAGLLHSFRDLVAAKSSELSELKQKDPTVEEKVVKFVAEYDRIKARFAEPVTKQIPNAPDIGDREAWHGVLEHNYSAESARSWQLYFNKWDKAVVERYGDIKG